MTADIGKLAVVSWRGILVPCKLLRHRFAHEASPQHVSFGKGDYVDMTGQRARTWAGTIAFNDNVTNFQEAFSKSYPEFYRAYYEDRSPGTLVTPLQGPVLCVPGSYEEELAPQVRDGLATCEVIWTEHTPVKGSQLDAPPNLKALFADASNLDTSITSAKLPDVNPPHLTDPITAIAATVNKLNSARDRIRAVPLAVANRANSLEKALDRLGSNGGPKANSARLAARKLRLNCERVANAPPREVAGIVEQSVVSTPQTIFQLAREAKMDLKDFIDLNFQLARTGIIPPGTVYFARKAS